MIEREAAGSRLPGERLVGDLPERVVGEHELDRVVAEEALILAHEGILGLDEDLDEILAAQLMHRRDERGAPMNSGTRPKFIKSSGITSERSSAASSDWRERTSAPKPTGVVADAAGDDLVQAGERAAADEEHVRRVDREELLVRVLAPALGRHRRDGAFEDLQQRLLPPSPETSRDRRVAPGDLVDLVDVDDPGLGLLDVEVGCLDQLEQDVLDVFADVAASVGAVASAIANGTLRIRASKSAPAAPCRSRSGRAAGC